MEKLQSLAFQALVSPDPRSGLSVFHSVCIEGNNEMIRAILHFSPTLLDTLMAVTVTVEQSSSRYSFKTPEQILKDLNNYRALNILSPYTKSMESRSLIHLAARSGTVSHIRRVLDGGGDVNQQSFFRADEYSTPVFLAVAKNTLEVVKELLLLGANLYDEHRSGFTPAHFASLNGRTDTLLYLLEIDSNFRDVRGKGLTPLHLAAWGGYTDTVGALISYGADIDAPKEFPTEEMSSSFCPEANLFSEFDEMDEGITPLMIAAANNHLDTLELLVQSGASLDVRDYYNRSALFLPAQRGHCEIVRYLITAGIDIEVAPNKVEDEESENLLFFVSDPNCAELLIENGVNVNSRYDKGKTPLHYAAERGDIKMADVLLAHGADIEAGDISGTRPLHVAARSSLETTKFLVERGVDINATDVDGNTALHKAAGNRQVDTMRYLLKLGCVIDGWSSSYLANIPLSRVRMILCSPTSQRIYHT